MCGEVHYLPQFSILSCIHALCHITLHVLPHWVEGTSLPLCVWPSDVLWLKHVTDNDSLMFLSLALSLLSVCHCHRRGWVAVLSSCFPLNLGPRISTSGRNQTPIYNKEPSSVGSATWAELSNILQVRWADPQVAHRYLRSIYCCMPLRFGSSLLCNNRWLIYTLSFRKKGFLFYKTRNNSKNNCGRWYDFIYIHFRKYQWQFRSGN